MAFAFQGFNYGKMVVGFLEERTEQTVKLFGEFAARRRQRIMPQVCRPRKRGMYGTYYTAL